MSTDVFRGSRYRKITYINWNYNFIERFSRFAKLEGLAEDENSAIVKEFFVHSEEYDPLKQIEMLDESMHLMEYLFYSDREERFASDTSVVT